MWKKDFLRLLYIENDISQIYHFARAIKIRIKKGNTSSENGLMFRFYSYMFLQNEPKKKKKIPNQQRRRNFSTQVNVDLLELFFLVEIFVDN